MHLIPTHRDAMMRSHQFLYPPGEVGLQSLIVFEVMPAHERLNARTCVPLLPVTFIAANVEISIREDRGHFADELVDENEGALAAWVHGRVEDTPFCFNCVRALAARKVRIPGKPRRCVAGHIELRHNADASIARIRDNFAHLLLRVVEAVRAPCRSGADRPLLLGAESLVVRKVPVEDVHLHRPSRPSRLRSITSTGWKWRLTSIMSPRHGKRGSSSIVHRWRDEALGCDRHELQESLQSVHRTQRIRCGQNGVRRRDLEMIRLILVHRPLDRIAWPIGRHRQGRRSSRNFIVIGDSGLAGERSPETALRALSSLASLCPSRRIVKLLSILSCPSPRVTMQRYGHQGKRVSLLRFKKRSLDGGQETEGRGEKDAIVNSHGSLLEETHGNIKAQ